MKTLRIVIIPILIACLPLTSRSAEVQATSSTQTPWFPDYLSNNKGLSDVSQYFRLNASKLDDEGKMNVYAYGRILGQVTTGFETRNELANDVVGRLYYLYLDYRDVVKDHLDLRAGRTFVPAAALPGTVDGLHLDLRNIGPAGPIGAGVTAFGGHLATFDNLGEISNGNDSLWGGSVYLETIRFTRLEASYARKLTDGSMAQQSLALDLSTTPIQMVNLTGRLRYDTVSSRYSEAQAGVTLSPLAAVVLRGEYYSSYPTFDQFSFYRFFNVGHYEMLGGSVEYRLIGDYRLSMRYAHERFDANATAHVVEGGISARPIRNLSLNVSYEGRNGYAGRLAGFRGSGAYRIQKATLLAGVDYDDFRRDAARDGTSKKYYAGLGYDFTRKITAVGRIENNINFYSNNLVQGFLALNVNL
jgi:hypothetical protein